MAGEIALVIIIAIVVVIICSLIGGLILWGCARGIGKVENSTFLNSWGLYWILSIVQFFIGLIWYGVMFAIGFSGGIQSMESVLAIVIITLILMCGLSVWIALGITKAFWKCTWKQSFMTHLVPMILYTLLTILQFLLLMTSPVYY